MREDIFHMLANPPISFVDCPKVASAPTTKGWGNKKDTSPMNSYASATVISTESSDRDQRHYLIDRMYTIYYTAKTALQRKFGLMDDEAPVTLADTVKRIQDGQFVIPEKYGDKNTYGSLSYIRWRDPKAVEDKAGYEAAKADLKKAFTKVEDTIRILPPADGLKALQDFEAAQDKKPAA